MKKISVLLAIAVLALCSIGVVYADIAIAPETDIQIMRLYDAEILNQDLEIEREAQTHLLGVDIKLGNLLLTPKIGVQSSMLEVAEALELTNELGLAMELDAECEIFGIANFGLALGGSYLYSQSEIDEIKLLPAGVSIDNPLRNDLTCHSYEVGAKIIASFKPMDFKPFVGIVYSDSNMNLSTDDLPIDFEVEAEAAKNLGLRLGAECSPIKNWSAKLEVKLLDQTAVTFSTSRKF